MRVTTPGGAILDASGGPGIAAAEGVRILRSERLKATSSASRIPRPGAYTIAPLPGSAAVSKVTEAEDPPDARVTATVRGRGTRRTLVYDIAARPDQRVTFVETSPEGNRPLGTVRGGKGTLTFAPAPGGGRRQIEAQFELAGVQAETRIVASFTPPCARLGRPARLGVRRSGTRLRVRWTRVAGAERYDVVTTPGDRRPAGDEYPPAQRGHRRRHPASGGRVTVRAVAPMRRGAIRWARFRATGQRAPTRFGPLPRLPRR